VKVWASFAKFEAEQARSMVCVRQLMDQAQDYFRDSQPDCKEERKMLLETWLELEVGADPSQADAASRVEQVRSKLPIKVKKRKPINLAE